MHQIFYIDADEEISSVIDKLNKSVSAENYFVVPKRAIFLQSIVNLKLLKREADKIRKQLVIVTQDEIGASMASRSGLAVMSSLENVETEESRDTLRKSEQIFEPVDDFSDEIVIDELRSKKNRLSAVGSSEFYAKADDAKSANHEIRRVAKPQSRKIPINSVSHAKKEERSFSGSASSGRHMESVAGGNVARTQVKPVFRSGIDPDKERTLEKMFSSQSGMIQKKESKENEVMEMSGAVKKIIISFVVLCLILFVGVAVYLFLPSAKLTIAPNIINEKIDMIVSGNSMMTTVDKQAVPMRIIDKNLKVTSSFDVSGGSSVGGKKAHGKVVVYNEFSNSPQTLIATTRLESADGKIFRIVKNVVVPGTVTVGAEVKPGAIEAEVVADQPGADFNLAPSSFKIPGFKDGPKYEKFYAKSTESFFGGSASGASTPGAVSQKDLDLAKQKTEEKAKVEILQAVSDDLKDDDIALDQNEKITTVKSATSVKVGAVTEKFDYMVEISIHALIFSEKDVKNVIKQAVLDKKENIGNDWSVSKLEYGIVTTDFEKNTIELKIHSEAEAVPNIDAKKLKNEILGKTDDQVGVILKNYSSIKSANVEFWPTFVTKIPQYGQRVTVEIVKN